MNRTVVFVLVAAIGCGLRGVTAPEAQDSKATSANVQEVDWKDLVPTGFDPNRLLRKYDQDVAMLTDNDPRAVRLAEELRKAWESASVVEALNNKIVRLSGFLVTLEGDGKAVSDFLGPFHSLGRVSMCRRRRPIRSCWSVRRPIHSRSNRCFRPYRSPVDFEPKPCAMTWRVRRMSSRQRMWSRRRARWRDRGVPFLTILLVGGGGGAQAHPHVLVVYSIVLSLPADGVDRIGFVFTFDPLFSAIILRNAGAGDPDDVLRNHEASLRQLPFEIEIAFNGTRVAMEAPTNLQVSTEGGQITYRFAVPHRGTCSLPPSHHLHRCR